MATQLDTTEGEYGIKSEYGHYIGGEWIQGDSGKTIDLILSLIHISEPTRPY